MVVFRRLFLFTCLLLLAAFVLPGRAAAHAHLVRADLAPDSHLVVHAGTYHFWFDEALNQSLSRIVVRNAQGQQVNSDTGRVDPANGEKLDVMLPALPNGQYSVFWTSDSAQDGHILHGFYVFTVGGPGAVAPAANAATIAAPQSPTLDTTALAAALAHWLVLVASALWTGALALQVLVLTPVRRATRNSSLLALCRAAGRRIVLVARLGLLATLVTSLLELGTQAYGAGGWSGVVSSSVLSDILGARYGTFWLARVALCFLALLVLGGALAGRPRGIASGARRSPLRVRLGRPSLAAANTTSFDEVAGEPNRTAIWTAAVLGLAYLLAVAFSGHAGSVSQLLATSVLLDWLHLIAMAVWVGGMSAIALALLPALHDLTTAGRAGVPASRLAFLDLLDRFSPAAYIAVGTAAFTGMFNAQVHLDSLAQFTGTAYGRFLLIKLALIAEMMLLSASHVFLTRPRLRALLIDRPVDAAPSQEALALRLRVEPLLGALILLCVALMGQVAPAVTVFTTPTQSSAPATAPVATPAVTAPASISGSATAGVLRATLTITPPTLGHARFRVTVAERGTPVTDGQVRIRLSVPGQSSLGYTFVETTPTAGGYDGAGDLAQNGQWQADVLVRTRDDPTEFRDVPFQFLVGPDAAFVDQKSATNVTISATPGLVTTPNTFTLGGIQQASAVRILSQSLDMNMGILPYPATSLGGGRWRVSNVFAPMNGRWGVTIQAQRNGSWITLRQVTYYVPLAGTMRLLTPRTGTNPAGLPARPTSLSQAYNLAFARTLPYTVLVTEMGSNGVRKLGGPIAHTGLQAHGVDALDGTPYAYVTNFGAAPGTVTQIDLRTMRVVRTFSVGLGPAHVVFTPDHRRAFVTDFRSNDLYMLDLVKGTSRLITFPNDTCFEPHGIDISEDGHTLYVACAGGAWIYTVDSRTLKPGSTVVTAPGAYGVAVDRPRHEVWVTNQTANDVSVIDERTLKVLATVQVGKGPALLVATPDGSKVYVADQLGNQISVIDAARRKVIATLPVAAQPHGPDVTADGKYVYVASIGGNAVTIIRTSDNRVMAVVPAPIGSNEAAVAN
ncbi:MAG TPA: CopD family protein [Chloroflexota bacterium]|nr:CopD family protein [Chloroflexota bacterium]